MGVGRYICVSVPFVLTIASLIALLVATLSGVTHNNLYIFRVNITELSIDPSSAGKLSSLVSGATGINIPNVRADTASNNITAAKLGLKDVYDVTLWGYCGTSHDGKRECTKAQFDWASHELNTTWTENFGSAAGVKIKLPDEIKGALEAFRHLSKWTEVAFIVALIAVALEIVVGLFSGCSRAVSCVTWFTAGIAAVLVGLAAALATATSAVVVGAVEGAARNYGVDGTIGNGFLAASWIAFAFAVGAAFFWLFTICCCKPEHRSRSGRRGGNQNDGEKLLPSKGYAPIGSDNQMSGAHGDTTHYPPNQPYGSQPPRYPGGNERSNLAYEPYSHRA
ncbi:hypothetical protein HIM_09108 [Hirsutella minnesotensis 3608]|uniref:Integral membrane protein n=1 Tax=Hirsutella minnesotensis 3608 TaxID=1043627 RepID=A0A0F8A3A1_9HYPO|nr:hypothetical protein HIM_09108 [Hirsutella minnesotensis 3608]